MEPPAVPPSSFSPPAPCSAARSLQDELTCPVCLEYFTDPVLVADCGHNFCRACVTQCWEDSARRLCCPQCREPVPQRLFRPNRSLGNIVHIVRQLGLPSVASAELPAEEEEEGGPAEPPSLPAAPGPAGPTLEAVALGPSVEAAPGPEPQRCSRHGEPLRLLCLQDGRALCVVCPLSREHRGHTVVPAEEATLAAEEVPQERLSSLRKSQEEAKAKRERQSQELLRQVELERQKVLAECQELRSFLEEKEQLLLSRLEELERDIGLRREESSSHFSEELEKLDKGLVPVGSSLLLPRADPGLSELERRIRGFGRRSSGLRELLLEFRENLRFELENDTGELWLDPETANPYLVLSEDGRSLRLRGRPQQLPPSPKRFERCCCVLAAQGFRSGRHYWEVEVGDGQSWVLGAARQSVPRKEKIDFAPEEGIWAIGLNWKGKNWDQYQAFTSPETPLNLCERPRKIGVYLDYEGGWVAFYNGDTMAPIFTFTAAFSESIFPFFWLFYVGSSLSLCN